MPALLRRLTVWLCLTAALLSGIAPTQGFVLCLEPDGDVCFSVPTSEQRCGGCRTSERDSESTTLQRVENDACCTCTDFALPGRAEDECTVPLVKRIYCVVGMLLPPAPAFCSITEASAPVRSPPRAVPRPPPVLVCIGCDVLLV